MSAAVDGGYLVGHLRFGAVLRVGRYFLDRSGRFYALERGLLGVIEGPVLCSVINHIHGIPGRLAWLPSDIP